VIGNDCTSGEVRIKDGYVNMNTIDLEDVFSKAGKHAELTYDDNIDLEGDSWELAALMALLGHCGKMYTGEVIFTDGCELEVQPPGKLDIKLRKFPGLITPKNRMTLSEFLKNPT